MTSEDQDLLSRFWNCRNSLANLGLDIASRNPSWDQGADARLGVFWQMLSVCQTTAVALHLARGPMREISFWRNYPGLEKAPEETHTLRDDYEKFVRVGFVQVLTSVIESSMRLFCEAVSGTGPTKFSQIRRRLLPTLVSLPPDVEQLFEAWARVRNTIHNNGVYIDLQNVPVTVFTYNNWHYKFEDKSQVRLTWEFLLHIAEQLAKALDLIVNASPLREVAFIPKIGSRILPYGIGAQHSVLSQFTTLDQLPPIE